MGRYEKIGTPLIHNLELDYDCGFEEAVVALKVLDTIADNTQDLPINEALNILDDAKKLLLQMVAI